MGERQVQRHPGHLRHAPAQLVNEQGGEMGVGAGCVDGQTDRSVPVQQQLGQVEQEVWRRVSAVGEGTLGRILPRYDVVDHFEGTVVAQLETRRYETCVEIHHFPRVRRVRRPENKEYFTVIFVLCFFFIKILHRL